MTHFFLADCNNFFVSCERLFNPSLEGKSVLVLSSNDGCVIARSQESKLLGFKMGDPYFKIKDKCKWMGVNVLSSNYQLYKDISERVMNTLSQSVPEIEIYSIDEAFFRFPNMFKQEDLLQEAIRIKKLVRKSVGIPISIGIAPTKTLAKAANLIAKNKNRKTGVFSLMHPFVQGEILKDFPIEDVWGIGPKSSQKLKNIRVFSAEDFLQMDPLIIREKTGILGEKTFWELKGTSTSGLQSPEPKKSLTISRSFGDPTSNISDIEEALSTFASTACIKLRNQKSFTSTIQVYLEIASFERGQYTKKHYKTTATFQVPTNDTSQIITAAKTCLKELYREREVYKKCGIILSDFILEKDFIPDFFSGSINQKRSALMFSIDNINKRFGKNAVFLGATGTKNNWQPKSQLRSSYSTTELNQLPIAYARE